MILKRVRAGRAMQFRYRCDSPASRRQFEMAVTPQEPGMVQFASTLLSEEARPPVAALEEGRARDDRLLPVCSWCQRVALPDGAWVAVEEAVARMNYLEASTLPEITHGICPTCSAEMMRMLSA
jgi:hypothetical protein